MPETTKLMIQLTSAMRSGERPLTSAPTSVSAEARVARPKRVKRKITVSTMPRAMIVPANHKRSVEMLTPEEADVVLREDRVDQDDLRADLVGHDGGEHAHQSDGGHGLGDGPVVAQRPEDEQVDNGPHHGLDGRA